MTSCMHDLQWTYNVISNIYIYIYTLPVKKNRTPDKIAHVYVYGAEY